MGAAFLPFLPLCVCDFGTYLELFNTYYSSHVHDNALAISYQIV